MNLADRMSDERAFRMFQEMKFVTKVFGERYSGEWMRLSLKIHEPGFWTSLTKEQKDENDKTKKVISFIEELYAEVVSLEKRYFKTYNISPQEERAILYGFTPYKGLLLTVLEYIIPTIKYMGELDLYVNLLQFDESGFADEPDPVLKSRPKLKVANQSKKPTIATPEQTQKVSKPIDKIKTDIERLEGLLDDLK